MSTELTVLSGSSHWTHETAYNVLKTGGSSYIIQNLEHYFDHYLSRFRRCYEIIVSKDKSGVARNTYPAEKNWTREKVEEDRQNLTSLLNIDSNEALRIVLHGNLRGIFSSDKRLLHHARLYLSEQRHLLKIVSLLFTYRVETPSYLLDDFKILAETYSAEIMADPDFLSGIIKTIISNFNNPIFLESDDDELASLFVSECLLFQIDLLNLLLIAVITILPSSSPLIDHWADAIEVTEYFTYPATPMLEKHQNLIDTIFSLCTTITIAFFDLEQDFSIEGASSQSYINNPDILTKLHKSFTTLLKSKPTASPAVFGWSCILNTVAIRYGEQPNPALDPFITSTIPKTYTGKTNDIPKEELLIRIAENIASEALNSNLFSLLEKAFQFLPQESLYASVFKSYLKAGLPYTSLTDPVVNCIKTILGPFPFLSEDIFTDVFGDRLFSLASLRFPTSISPFIKLSQCLGETAFDAISELDTFMQPLPKEFTEYEFVGASSTTIKLTNNLSVLSKITGPEGSDKAIVIPVGTQGTIHTINQTRYVIWQYKYPGWGFLGSILERACNISSSNVLAPAYDDDTVNIIQLLTSTLSAMQLDPEKVKHVLEIAGELLVDSDIIDVIFKILEDAMCTNNISLASSCVDFISTLAYLLPDRVWSFLSRSTMLGKNGQRSDIATILGSTEIVSGKFDFTISVLHLTKVLVDSSVQSTLTSKVSLKVRADIVLKLIRHAVAVFESFAYWGYSDSRQKIKIAFESVTTFENILHYLFDVDQHSSLLDKVTSVLSPSAEYLAQQFLAPEKVVTRAMKPLIGTIESTALSVTNLDADRPLENEEALWIFSAFNLSSALVQARSYLLLPPSQLEKSIFSLSPYLSILYSRYPALRGPIMDVFISIVKAHWPSSEQPSLLAHLGKHAHMFISNLTGSLQNGLESERTLTKIAFCFTSIIESQQEGLSILLLTGRDTRKASQIEQEVTSLLQVTEKKISTDKNLPQELLLPFLRSVASAYSNWKLGTISSGQEFSISLKTFVDECYQLNIDDEMFDEFQFVDYAYKYSIAEQALLIFAVQMYKSPTGAAAQSFIQYLEENDRLLHISKVFLGVTRLRAESHESLVKNFDFRWPKLGGLRKFAKPRFYSLEYGPDYIYDVRVLDTVLLDQKSWVGYRKEVIAGNMEYSWVEAQLGLVQAWCTFGTSLTLYLSKSLSSSKLGGTSKKLMNMLNKVSGIAISKILNEEYSAPVLIDSIQHRINLVFMIKYHTSRCDIGANDQTALFDLYKLLESPDYKLREGIINNSNVPFPSITYRPLLRTLCITLEGLSSVSESTYQVLQTIYGIFRTVIVDGMTAAVQAARSQSQEGADADMVIIISIMRKCLAIDGVRSLFPKIALLLIDSQCVKSVMSLYSYSDKLPSGHDEAIYGELALDFLLECLNIDQVADQLVSNGLLDLLMESPISRRIQEGGIKPTTNSKLHTLWVKGILPILLTLLQKVGPRIVSDTLVVLDFFLEQAKFAITAWRNPSEISLSVITETTQIFILADMLQKLSSIPEVISEQLQGILASREEVIGSFDYLLSHPRFLNASLVATSSEEQHFFLIEDASDIPEGNKLLTLVQNELKEVRELLQSPESETE